MTRPLEDSVVVLTGATSGIGRAAAHKFARRGARLALAARSAPELGQVQRECELLGAETLVMPLDVGEEKEVEALAASTTERFGRIDVWVNNAGTMAYGEFLDIPSARFRRVIETTFFGQVHGSRAALSRFREQGSGVLINLCSVWGRLTTPKVSPYVASKHALRAFSECLREELADARDIHVSVMLPQAVDTPIWERAGNYSGQRMRPIPPLVDPEAVADGIVACAESPKSEVTWGRAGRLLEILYSIAPRAYCRFAPAAFERATFFGSAEQSDGAVEDPVGPYRVHGGWRSGRRPELRRAMLAATEGALRGLTGRAG